MQFPFACAKWRSEHTLLVSKSNKNYNRITAMLTFGCYITIPSRVGEGPWNDNLSTSTLSWHHQPTQRIPFHFGGCHGTDPSNQSPWTWSSYHPRERLRRSFQCCTWRWNTGSLEGGTSRFQAGPTVLVGKMEVFSKLRLAVGSWLYLLMVQKSGDHHLGWCENLSK